MYRDFKSNISVVEAMDKELELLLTKYKSSLELLSEINNQAEKVNLSQVIASQLTVDQVEKIVEKPELESKDSNKKINEILNKLRTNVDSLLNKRLAEVEVSKSAVQSYIDNTIWNLFSRTELQNGTLLFSNDPNRKTDKKRLLEMTSTCIEFERHVQQQESSKEVMVFSSQLHEWMIHVITIYLRISTSLDKKKLLLLLVSTPNISTWAIPLIQFNTTETDEYLQALDIIFCSNDHAWTEDDLLMVLDQLAIDYNYNKAIETFDSPDLIFEFTQKLTNCLAKALTTLTEMNNLMKRLSQTILQISIILTDTINEKEWKCQDRIDGFMQHLVHTFHDLKQTGWFFLPNIPFKVLSTDALWKMTTKLLQIKDTPTSLDQVNITRFQYELHDNQIQGYFMLSCLTNISLAVHDTSTLSNAIITTIAYTLFTVAFIDKELREVFYKDVRDNLAMICRYHPFMIPLLFHWTIDNLGVMERMSLYLFHSIRLDQWDISKEDLKRVHKLFTTSTTQQTAQVQLGKHILGHLNYGYRHDSIDTSESKSQPWHSRKLPYLSYDTHEEIAFMLLNICQQFQPLPDAKQENKGAIELVGSVMSSYLPITDQIQLLKTTSSLGTDMIQWAWSIATRLKLYDCPISKRATEIESSIDLSFLKLVLNSHNTVSASHSALLIYIAFMLSATSRHFLRFEASDGWMKLLVILKRGHSITHILSEIVPSFVYMHGDDFFNDESLVDLFRHMIPNGVQDMMGSHLWQANLIDSVMEEHGKGFSYVDLMMHSWLKTVFKKTDWMSQAPYVSVVDSLCKFAFILHRQDLVHNMLQEEQKRLQVQQSPRITRFLKNMVGSFSTLLVGDWSVLKSNTPGVESQYLWFAFQVLVMETEAEKPYLDELTKAIAKHVSTTLTNDQEQTQEQHKASIDLAVVYKNMDIKKPLEFFAIYRWLQHILIMPADHPLLPLYIQMFTSLYFQTVDNVTLGYFFFNKKKDQISKLRDHLTGIQKDTKLRDFYHEVWLWFGEKTTASSRLESCHEGYWLDLVNMDQLEQEFLNFSWEGSEKFRTTSDGQSSSVTEDIESSVSTTTRKLKLITDESMIAPLPPIVINKPSTSKV